MTKHQIENPDKFRGAVREELNKFFQNENYARNLEKGIQNWTLKEATSRKVVKKWDNSYFARIYLDHLKSIYINLKRNPEIIENVKNGTIKPHTIAFMTHQEINPTKWDPLIQAKIKRDKNKFETNIEAATDTFKCRKCRSNKCTYYQMQTRSADEPMTTFVCCIDCGQRWKC